MDGAEFDIRSPPLPPYIVDAYLPGINPRAPLTDTEGLDVRSPEVVIVETISGSADDGWMIGLDVGDELTLPIVE